jgi:hypothetical protein
MPKAKNVPSTPRETVSAPPPPPTRRAVLAGNEPQAQHVGSAPAPAKVRRAATRKKPATFVAPELPPQTEAERATAMSIRTTLLDLAHQYQQRNLQTAVLLAQQAAAGRGPLVDHFAELGRRYAELLRLDKAQRPTLRVIEGAGGARNTFQSVGMVTEDESART